MGGTATAHASADARGRVTAQQHAQHALSDTVAQLKGRVASVRARVARAQVSAMEVAHADLVKAAGRLGRRAAKVAQRARAVATAPATPKQRQTAPASRGVPGAGAQQQQTQQTQQPPDWHVARAARDIYSLPVLQPEHPDAAAFLGVAASLAARMGEWHRRWSGDPSWSHFLNKKAFLHEIEEVLLPCLLLQAAQATDADRPPGPAGAGAGAGADDAPAPAPDDADGLTVVDLCAGKGFLTMCLAHGVLPATPGVGDASVVRRVVLVEKADVNWAHLPKAPAREGLPVVDIWGPGANIHTEEILQRLSALPGRVVLVGIHLCRGLSARAVELYNLLGPAKAVALVLAPCCIPLARGVIDITGPKHDAASGVALWAGDVASTPWAPGDRASGPLFCWNCGMTGHETAACQDPPSGLSKGQIRRRRKYSTRRLVAGIDTTAVVQAPNAFEAWSAGLVEGVVTTSKQQRPVVVKLPTSGGSGDHDGGEDATTRDDRKMSFILAGRACEWWQRRMDATSNGGR